MSKRIALIVVAAVAALAATLNARQGGSTLTADQMKPLQFRSLGPSYTTGRVQDVEVDPNHPNTYYAAAAAGGLWKSENRGDTWTPIFDQGGAFNLCCVVVDPRDSNVLWLGT